MRKREREKSIKGNWQEGWTLDQHTLSSVKLPGDGFDNTRTVLGEMLYKLKYKYDRTWLQPIATQTSNFLKSRKFFPSLNAIIPIPPSETNRPFQPVLVVASKLGQLVNLPVPLDYLEKIRETSPLKGLDEKASRREQLQGAFRVADDRFAGQSVLLFDDLYRSGETLNSATDILKNQGRVARVYVLALTRTRTKR